MYFAMTLLVFTALNVHVIDVHILSVYFRIYRQSSGCTQVVLSLVSLCKTVLCKHVCIHIYCIYVYVFKYGWIYE